MSSLETLKKYLGDHGIKYIEAESSFKIPDLEGMTYRYNGSVGGKETWAKELIEQLGIK